MLDVPMLVQEIARVVEWAKQVQPADAVLPWHGIRRNENLGVQLNFTPLHPTAKCPAFIFRTEDYSPFDNDQAAAIVALFAGRDHVEVVIAGSFVVVSIEIEVSKSLEKCVENYRDAGNQVLEYDWWINATRPNYPDGWST